MKVKLGVSEPGGLKPFRNSWIVLVANGCEEKIFQEQYRSGPHFLQSLWRNTNPLWLRTYWMGAFFRGCELG